VFYGGTLTVTPSLQRAVALRCASRPACSSATRIRTGGCISREYLAGPLFYLLATLIGLANVSASLAIHGFIALLYVLPNRSRRIAPAHFVKTLCLPRIRPGTTSAPHQSACWRRHTHGSPRQVASTAGHFGAPPAQNDRTHRQEESNVEE